MNELIAFIAEQTGTKINKINKNSLLEKDLHVYGDKAHDLLRAYSEKYNVDISKFHFPTYFSLQCLPFMRRFNDHIKTKELSVTDMYNGILEGELDSKMTPMDELIIFIAEETATRARKITKDSLMEKDLGVYGDDAVDFLIAYGKKYNVDLSKFPISTYFNPEGMPCMRGFFNLSKSKELSITDLYNGILKGELLG